LLGLMWVPSHGHQVLVLGSQVLVNITAYDTHYRGLGDTRLSWYVVCGGLLGWVQPHFFSVYALRPATDMFSVGSLCLSQLTQWCI